MFQSPTKPANYLGQGVTTLSAALALVMMHAIPASAEEISFSPGQVAAGQNIQEFAISPDGTQVVFNGNLNDGITGGHRTYVANVASDVANPATQLIPSTTDDADGGVRWTPDGQSVITRFDPSGNGGNVNEIYRIPADGVSAPQQLTFNSINAFDPRVSSDGNHLFYSNGSSLYRTPIVGASATSSVLLNPGNISEIDTGEYSLVGSDVIFSGFSTPVVDPDNGTREDTLYRTAADGTGSPVNVPITNFPTDTALNFNRFEATSDGQSIIFQGDLTTNNQEQLYRVPAAGGEFVPLFDAPRPDFDVNLFKVSNDGSMVAFVSDYLTNGVGEAFVVPTAGGEPVRVSDSDFFAGTAFDVAFTGLPDRLQFSPDDKFLYYVADADSERQHDGAFTLHRVAVPLIGDFDNDGDVDTDDVDLLSANIGEEASVNPAMDLDNDDDITLADHDQHITTLLRDANGTGALIGDLNLDGDVDVSQIQIVNGQPVNNGDASRLLANLGQTTGQLYADGDLNGDGDVDVSQIVIINGQPTNLGDASRLLANLGQTTGSASPASAAVPEPSSAAVLLALVGGAAVIRRRK